MSVHKGAPETHPIEVIYEKDKFKFRPTVWGRTGFGFHIRTLQPAHYDEVCKLLEEHYLPTDILTKHTNLSDYRVDVISFLKQARFNMQNDSSLILVDDWTHKIVGVLLMRIVNKLDFGSVISREEIVAGASYRKCTEIKAKLYRQADIYAEYNTKYFMRAIMLCVHGEYRGLKLGLHLLRNGLQMARVMRIPIASGIFASGGLQETAERLGFKTRAELVYAELFDKEHTLIVDKPGYGNEVCAYMVAEVPPPILAQILVPEPIKKKKKKGKKGKGKGKGKKKK